MFCCLSISCRNHPTCLIPDTSSVSRQQQSHHGTETQTWQWPQRSASLHLSPSSRQAQVSSSRSCSTSKAAQKQCCYKSFPRAGAMSLNISSFSSSKLEHPSRAKDFIVRLGRPNNTILVRCMWPLWRNSGLVLGAAGTPHPAGDKDPAVPVVVKPLQIHKRGLKH